VQPFTGGQIDSFFGAQTAATQQTATSFRAGSCPRDFLSYQHSTLRDVYRLKEPFWSIAHFVVLTAKLWSSIICRTTVPDRPELPIQCRHHWHSSSLRHPPSMRRVSGATFIEETAKTNLPLLDLIPLSRAFPHSGTIIALIVSGNSRPCVPVASYNDETQKTQTVCRLQGTKDAGNCSLEDHARRRLR